MKEPREFWIEERKRSVIASNRMLCTYDTEQLALAKEHDPEFDKKILVRVIEKSAFDQLKRAFAAQAEALQRLLKIEVIPTVYLNNPLAYVSCEAADILHKALKAQAEVAEILSEGEDV